MAFSVSSLALTTSGDTCCSTFVLMRATSVSVRRGPTPTTIRGGSIGRGFFAGDGGERHAWPDLARPIGWWP
jgi:hypothetical protein